MRALHRILPPALLVLAVMPGPAARAAPPGRSAAVFLEAGMNVGADFVGVLVEAVAQEVRDSGAFVRVVSSRDIQQLLGFERQKQLMNCDSRSCMAEISGALGVSHMVTGSVARVGSSFILNMKVFDTEHATVLASVVERVAGDQEEAVLGAVHASVGKLLRAAFPAKREGVSAGPARGGALAWMLRGTGVLGVVAGALGLPLVLGLAGSSALLFLGALLPGNPLRAARLQLRNSVGVVSGALVAAGALVLVLGLLSAGGGAALAAGSMVFQ